MRSLAAMKQYQCVDVQAQVTEASPHRLIQMLMQGGLDRIYQAKGALERGAYAEKGELLGKAIAIVGGLREALDQNVDGDLVGNLDKLYEYMIMRLLEGNRSNDSGKLDEVANLLREVKSGWDAIA
ncbi:flagellar export chaperone FliS [Phytopseudomonas seleniipraecipitans]|uniref:Flagellar protein FliS n=1 Tax=Phytopseudomonas seleniipraecipitans TaxID=640205 RepID=A0A1G7NBD1_9GAMM|nr:flagellar export chaperone FliS [Pseudomonas seleniipraecipitans]SDF71405.1 flagellar protein FliS [Pseudomonas seleniipraecipitans]